MTFNGTTGYASVGSSSSLQPNSLSLEGWFKLSSGSGNRNIISANATTAAGYALSVNSSGKLAAQVCGALSCKNVASAATVD